MREVPLAASGEAVRPDTRRRSGWKLAIGPDLAVARTELAERLGRMGLALPEPYRSTIVLRFFKALPPRRVAERQGVPVETVRTRPRRRRHSALGSLKSSNSSWS